MVRYERDVIGQMEALTQLPDYPTENTVKGKTYTNSYANETYCYADISYQHFVI